MRRSKSNTERLKGLKILFEDESVMVVDKPEGMLTVHTKVVGRAAREGQLTAQNVLSDYLRKGQWKSNKQAYLVHRLDRETSGVMMFAKSERIAEKLREHWNETTEKTYLAIVEGKMEMEGGVFESWLKEDKDGYRVRSVAKGTEGAKKATTVWRRVHREAGQENDETDLVEVKLHTGRKNQIRVHFAEAGHPIVGDEKYHGHKAKRMYLHAWKLKFAHPTSGRQMEFESEGVDFR